MLDRNQQRRMDGSPVAHVAAVFNLFSNQEYGITTCGVVGSTRRGVSPLWTFNGRASDR